MAYHGYFRDGVKVAKSSYLKTQYLSCQCFPQAIPAVRDGNLITGQDDMAGPAFADLLVTAIKEKRKR